MKFHTQLKAKDIFKFSLAYTYSGVQAILTIFMLGVGAYMIVQGIGQPEGQTNITFLSMTHGDIKRTCNAALYWNCLQANLLMMVSYLEMQQ